MNIINRFSAALAGTVAVVAAAATLGSAAAPKFFTDDPIWIERDTQDGSGMKPLELDLMVDLASSIVSGSNIAAPSHHANVNSIDEVPDSSRFTNRAGQRPLTPED